MQSYKKLWTVSQMVKMNNSMGENYLVGILFFNKKHMSPLGRQDLARAKQKIGSY